MGRDFRPRCFFHHVPLLRPFLRAVCARGFSVRGLVVAPAIVRDAPLPDWHRRCGQTRWNAPWCRWLRRRCSLATPEPSLAAGFIGDQGRRLPLFGSAEGGRPAPAPPFLRASALLPPLGPWNAFGATRRLFCLIRAPFTARIPAIPLLPVSRKATMTTSPADRPAPELAQRAPGRVENGAQKTESDGNGAKLRAVIFDFLRGRRPFHV